RTRLAPSQIFIRTRFSGRACCSGGDSTAAGSCSRCSSSRPPIAPWCISPRATAWGAITSCSRPSQCCCRSTLRPSPSRPSAAAFLGLNALRPGNPDPMTFYLATACLILIAAVVEASYHMAYEDSLTGLPARRALSEALLRLGGHYTLAMADVDHFKSINDRHGHDVGDQVLRMIAAKLAQVPGGGKAYRYGGEEFAVIFTGQSAEQCLPNLDELRKTVEDTRFILRARFRSKKKKEKVLTDRGPGERVPVTISIGVAEKTDRHLKSDQVIKAADRAL